MADDDKAVHILLPPATLIERAGAVLSGTVVAFAGVTFFGMFTAMMLSSIETFAFVTFSLALLATTVRHMIRIDRAEESDNFEEISLRDRWHFSVPRRPPTRDDN